MRYWNEDERIVGQISSRPMMTRRLTSLVLALALGLFAAQETDLEENCDVPLGMCFWVEAAKLTEVHLSEKYQLVASM